MANIPVQPKRASRVPVWIYPVLVALVALTAWVVVANSDDASEGDGPDTDSTVVSVAPIPEAAPAPTFVPGTTGPPPGDPIGAGAEQTALGATEQAAAAQAAATRAAIRAGTVAGAAAGAEAGRAVLASVGDVGRTIRESGTAAGALNGRAVQIAGVRVSSVLSDRAFTVGSGPDRVMVVMDPTGGAAPVRVGDQVAVTGSLETYAPGMSESGVADAGESGYVVVARPGGIDR